MMKNPRLYSAQNVDRARYAQIAVTVLALAVSGYLAFTTLSGVRQVCSEQSMLAGEQKETRGLSRQVSALKRQEAKQPSRNDGGVDVFALQVSRWATEQGVRVESVTPQGAPIANEVTMGSSSLGTWNAVKVRVEGEGDFQRVAGLLSRFRRPGMPVQLESFAFQSSSGGSGDAISFDLMLTVYERKSGAS